MGLLTMVQEQDCFGAKIKFRTSILLWSLLKVGGQLNAIHTIVTVLSSVPFFSLSLFLLRLCGLR